jgi:integrase
MAYGGLRAGEVGGLRLADIDFGRSQVHISQQVVRVAGDGLRVTVPKTQAARRVVTLPRSVMRELREYVAEKPPTSDGLVVKGRDGGMRDAVRINDALSRRFAGRGSKPTLTSFGTRRSACGSRTGLRRSTSSGWSGTRM